MKVESPRCYLYQVTNKLNDMKYIGITNNVARRFAGHCRNTALRTKSFLNSAIIKYGKENFEIKVLLIGSRTYCMEAEANLIKSFNTISPNGYNISGGNDGPIAARSGKNNPMYGKKSTNSPLFGRKHAVESIKKMSEKRVGSNNPMFGVSGDLSVHSKKFVAIDPNGKKYMGIGLSDFSKQHNLLPSGMRNVANGRRNHHKGWKAVYVNKLQGG